MNSKKDFQELKYIISKERKISQEINLIFNGLDSKDNEEKRMMLFYATVHGSYAGRATGAIERLLRSTVRRDLSGDLEKYRHTLDNLREVAPPWIASKIRGVLSVLHFG